MNKNVNKLFKNYSQTVQTVLMHSYQTIEVYFNPNCFLLIYLVVFIKVNKKGRHQTFIKTFMISAEHAP